MLLGAAKALQFLHTCSPKVIHGDVKRYTTGDAVYLLMRNAVLLQSCGLAYCLVTHPLIFMCDLPLRLCEAYFQVMTVVEGFFLTLFSLWSHCGVFGHYENYEMLSVETLC